MRRFFALCCLLAAFSSVGLLAPSARPADKPLPAVVEFNRDIRPILSENCYACHGPDKNQRKADLRLDTEEGAFASIEGRHALVRGKPQESELYLKITSEEDSERMPPKKFGKHLTQRQTDLIRRWIEQGAKWQKHWSLIVPQRPETSKVSDAKWVRNPIDFFILGRLEQEGLKPSPEAARRTLLRRLSFDLTGLPPTPEEVDGFIADVSPNAYEKQVDRLLASPHFGERLAIYWLDLVRFADSAGYHSDNPRNVAPFRDYVINAFNKNKPFDQFTIEQLAGDLLPNPTLEQKIGSGYNRLLLTTEEGGAQPKEYAAKYLADRVRNFSGVWLGMTMGCAECHDHKFDPTSTKDFYSIAAFFADVSEIPVGRREPGILVPTDAQAAQLKQLEERLETATKKLNQPSREIIAAAALAKGMAAWLNPSFGEFVRNAKSKNAFVNKIPRTLVTVAVAPATVRIKPRGNWMDDTGEVVPPATPHFLASLSTKDRRATRLDLAKWLVDKDNPLTARVFVNRLWKLFFGQGISRSLEDLGTQGEWPTHPELLDWLAVEFRESGWNMKHMIKLMVMANTYRQRSEVGKELKEKDPENRLLARQARFRIDAEFVRDNALAVSGLLVRKIGGPSVKPYQPAGYWDYMNFPVRTWQNDHGENLYRRGLYTHWQRTFLQPGMIAFDASPREECAAERSRSNIPQQALVLLNDPTYVEAARVFGAKIIQHGGSTDVDRLTWAYRQALSRRPSSEETAVLTELLEKHRRQFTQDRPAAEQLIRTGEFPVPKERDAVELAAWTSTARAIMNLHEGITRE